MKLITTSNPTAERELASLPENFLVASTTTGGTQALRPMSRIQFRKEHGLGNAAAKREYAGHLKRFTVAAQADFNAMVTQGRFATGMQVTKGGVRVYKLAELDLPAGAPALVTKEAALAALGLTEDQLAALTPAPAIESK